MINLPSKFQLSDLVKFMGGQFTVDAVEFSEYGVLYKLLPPNPDESQYHILAKERYVTEGGPLELNLNTKETKL